MHTSFGKTNEITRVYKLTTRYTSICWDVDVVSVTLNTPAGGFVPTSCKPTEIWAKSISSCIKTKKLYHWEKQHVQKLKKVVNEKVFKSKKTKKYAKNGHFLTPEGWFLR